MKRSVISSNKYFLFIFKKITSIFSAETSCIACIDNSVGVDACCKKKVFVQLYWWHTIWSIRSWYWAAYLVPFLVRFFDRIGFDKIRSDRVELNFSINQRSIFDLWRSNLRSWSIDRGEFEPMIGKANDLIESRSEPRSDSRSKQWSVWI